MSGPSHLNPLSRPSLLSIREAAVYLGVPPETVRWWLRVKRLRKVKIGRRVLIRLDDLQDLVAISTEGATGGLQGPTSAIQKPLGVSRPDGTRIANERHRARRSLPSTDGPHRLRSRQTAP